MQYLVSVGLCLGQAETTQVNTLMGAVQDAMQTQALAAAGQVPGQEVPGQAPGQALGQVTNGKGAAGGQAANLQAKLLTVSMRFTDRKNMPTQLCQFWVDSPSSCAEGNACPLAHGLAELEMSSRAAAGISRFHHTGFTPKVLCKFAQTGHCGKGLLCTFAHSQEEL